MGTGTLSAVVVDVARMLVYGLAFYTTSFVSIPQEMGRLIAAAVIAA